MTEDNFSTGKHSKLQTPQTTNEKPVSKPGVVEKTEPASFPAITIEQLDEMLEERQSGDRRKSIQPVDFPDRRVKDRREADSSANQTRSL